MSGRISANSSFWFVVFLCAAVSFLYYFVFFAKAQVTLEIEVEQACWFKIYWADADTPFSESEMARVRLRPGKTQYRFPLVNLRSFDQLRIDTHDYEGAASLHSMTIRQKNFQTVTLNSNQDFSQLTPLNQIRKKSISDGTLYIVSGGNDPNFLFEPDLQPAEFSILTEAVRVLAICGVVYLCYFCFGFLAVDFRFVPLCMVAVLLLVTTMALISRENVHPDEFVHAKAVQYYKTNWLPPEVEDPAIRSSYSPYGVSRLHSDEIYYFAAGKFAKIVEPLCLNGYICARSFGVFLVLLMTLATLRIPESRVVALPLLVSPQIWYVFSYCNSDGFAVAAAFFAGCQVVRPRSMLSRFLRGEITNFGVPHILFGCGFGVLLLLKHNYLPFVLFVMICCAVYCVFRVEAEQRAVFLRRSVVVVLIGLAVFGSKKGVDYLVNGPERAQLIKQVAVETASPDLAPDAPLEVLSPTLHMKERGVQFRDIVERYLWHTKTFTSAFGVYGYFKLSGGYMYYFLVKWSALLLLGYVMAVLLVRGGSEGRLIAMAAILLSIALVGASLNHSWTSDFQPQGRYLFPIAGMLGVVCGQAGPNLSERWTGLLTFWMFLLSLYSFIIIGLHYIPRNTCL